MAINNRAAGTLISKWNRESAAGKNVEIYKSVSLCTLDVMLRCAFSYESDVQLEDNKYVNTVNGMATLILQRGFKPWLNWDKLYYNNTNGKKFKSMTDYVHNVADDVIEKRKGALKKISTQNDKRYVDFLDILLLAKDESENGLTDEEIRHEVDTFMFEGHDTTASAISWILYALAKHPEFQKQCREEVNKVIEDPTSPIIEWDGLQKIPFLTQCIKEALRLFSPVPIIGRELKNPLEIDGHIMPAGTFIDIQICTLHHNEHVWGKDHDEYKPERFHPDNLQKMDSHAFIPFSAGPRNCIDQNFAMHELKL